MNPALKQSLAAVALVLSFVAPAAPGPFEDGVVAFERGDYATALRLWRSLAEEGNAVAQFNLGLMYAYGRGVPQDYVLAHMWFNLAAAQGDQNAVKNRDTAAAKMTPAQIAEAQRLAREWKPAAPHR